MIKKKLYKLFIILMVGLSLSSGPIAQNEIAKMLEALSRTGIMQVQEHKEEKQSEEIKKKKRKFSRYFKDMP